MLVYQRVAGYNWNAQTLSCSDGSKDLSVPQVPHSLSVGIDRKKHKRVKRMIWEDV